MLTFVITVLSTIAVLAELGFYAALLWFTAPVGALSYLKARFGLLDVKPEPYPLNNASNAR